MANENRQVARLTYEQKHEFETASMGKERLSAFILTPEGKNSIGIRYDEACRYIDDQTEEVTSLKAQVQLQAAQMAMLAGQVGAAIGTVQFGATRAPNGFPFTYVVNSGSSDLVNPLTFARFPVLEGVGGMDSAIWIASAQAVRPLWMRAVGGVVKVYLSDTDTYLDTNAVASCASGTGILKDVVTSQVWGYVINYVDDGTPYLLPSSNRGFQAPIELLCMPGTRMRVPFSFVLDIGTSGASEIVFKASFVESYLEGEPYHYELLTQAFQIAGYGSGRTCFLGELITEFTDRPSYHHYFRSWIELRGPDPALSPLILEVAEPQMGGSFSVSSGVFAVSLGYSCVNPGGSDLAVMELLSASAFIEPPPANLIGTSSEEET